MRIRSLIRAISFKEITPKFSEKDERFIRKIEVERKALINYRQHAVKEGRIEPMIHVLEKIQDAIKSGSTTPAEKLEESLSLQPKTSYTNFMIDFEQKFGNFSMELYGSDKDLRIETIEKKGEIVPAVVKDVDEMFEYRKYYIVNFNLPGCLENINPNKFLRLKPIEEFPLMPLIPISASAMKRWEELFLQRKKEGYKFRIEKGKIYTSGMVFGTFIMFFVLLYFLYKKDEENWVRIEKGRMKKSSNEQNLTRGFY